MAEVLAPQAEPKLEQETSATDSADGAVAVHVEGEQKQQEQPEPISRGIYFVRVPFPQLSGQDKITKLETELSGCFTKLKALNNKFNVKKVRSVVVWYWMPACATHMAGAGLLPL